MFPIEQKRLRTLYKYLEHAVSHIFLDILAITALTLSQTSPVFYVPAVQVFLKTLWERKIAQYEQFLLFPQCFLPVS